MVSLLCRLQLQVSQDDAMVKNLDHRQPAMTDVVFTANQPIRVSMSGKVIIFINEDHFISGIELALINSSVHLDT